MNNPMPRDYTYTKAIATLIVDFDKLTDKLLEAKFDAIQKVFGMVECYARNGVTDKIVDAIMEKKATMILEATAIKDIKEIAEAPKPHYDGCRWHVSEHAVPEEELVLWFITSLKAPLVNYAMERYKELFEQVFGKSMDEV